MPGEPSGEDKQYGETMTTKEIMERYGVSRRAVYNWRERGLEPHGWDNSKYPPARTYLTADVESYYDDPVRARHRRISKPKD